MNIQELAAPFIPEAIHWRAQTLTKDGSKALALAYLNARDVMDRLDGVCGAAGWQDSYHETATGRVICSLSINIGGVWITKSDGAGNTAVEAEKGGISDAFKRAAVKWGVGRYLYDLANVWAPCEVNQNGKWKAWKPEAQRQFNAALLALGAPVVTIGDNQVTELEALLDATNFPVAEFINISKITKLTDLPAAKFEGAKCWINEQAKKKEAA